MNQQGPPGNEDEPPFDPDYDRPTPQHDTSAERALLGALILNPTLAPQLEPELQPTDFYNPIHTTIWTTAHHMAANGHHLDPITLAAQLTRQGDTNHLPGGALYLHTLATDCPNPAAAHAYAEEVRNRARLRTIAHTGTRLTDLARKADLTKIDTYLGEALQTLDDAVLRYGPTHTGPAHTGLADLTWILTGTPPEVAPPIYGRRTDGTALFYAGRVNGVFGDPECGKTWLAQVAGIEAMHDGDTFAMVDVDHNGQDHTAARLLLLGAQPEQIANPDLFRYYEPEDSEQLHAAIAEITDLAPAVVVIDSLGEILPMLGVKSIDNDEITAALRAIAMPPAKAGSCVIHIDHLPKSVEARSTGYAIGGTAKKRATDGAYLRAEARQQPVPGGTGRITLRIEKDRTGALRKSSGGGYAGTFTLNSTQPEITTWTIGRDEMPTNSDGTFRPTGYMEKVATFVANNEACTTNDIEAGIAGTAKHIRSALTILVTEGHITRQSGPRRSWLHTLTIPYREAEDDNAQPTL